VNSEFTAIIQKLVAEQGRETLANSSKCKALLADYTKSEYKKENRLLLQALDAGVQKAFDTAENIAICKKQQTRLLYEDYGMDEKMAAEVVDTLALVFRGDTTKIEITEINSGINQIGEVTTNIVTEQKTASATTIPARNETDEQAEKEDFKKRKRGIGVFLLFLFSAVYLFILWRTGIVNDPWKSMISSSYYKFSMLCMVFLPIFIFSIFVFIISNFLIGIEVDQCFYIIILVTIIQSITFIVWTHNSILLTIFYSLFWNIVFLLADLLWVCVVSAFYKIIIKA
jgi:hypothetical protein